MTPAVLALERAAVSYELLEYQLPPARGATRADVGVRAAMALGLPMEAVFKTLIAELSNQALVVAIIPVQGRLNLKGLARAAGAKSAALADSNRAERATGYVTGGISPLGQKTQLPTYLAEQAQQLPGLGLERIYVSAGKRGLELGLTPEDLISLTDATVAPLL